MIVVEGKVDHKSAPAKILVDTIKPFFVQLHKGEE